MFCAEKECCAAFAVAVSWPQAPGCFGLGLTAFSVLFLTRLYCGRARGVLILLKNSTRNSSMMPLSGTAATMPYTPAIPAGTADGSALYTRMHSEMSLMSSTALPMWWGSTEQWMDGGLVVCRSIFQPFFSIMSAIEMTLILGSVLHARA